MIRTALFAACVAAFLVAPGDASAYWPYMGYGGFGGGWGWGNYQPTNYIPAPPYFAVHPPVYYGPHINARHYGASPFAWLPGMSPITYVPETAAMLRGPIAVRANNLVAQTGDQTAALLIENPYVAKKVAASEPAETVQPTDTTLPAKIENPFFASR